MKFEIKSYLYNIYDTNEIFSIGTCTRSFTETGLVRLESLDKAYMRDLSTETIRVIFNKNYNSLDELSKELDLLFKSNTSIDFIINLIVKQLQSYITNEIDETGSVYVVKNKNKTLTINIMLRNFSNDILEDILTYINDNDDHFNDDDRVRLIDTNDINFEFKTIENGLIKLTINNILY